jgi:hypothetical protein
MSGATRQIIGSMSNSKGKAYVKELGQKLSPENIAKTKPETQKLKK